MPITSIFSLSVPRNLTSTLQHLQTLVGREEHRMWCGGAIPVAKATAFLTKMAGRYPLLRSTRERSYDRKRGRAAVHMIVCAPMDMIGTGQSAAAGLVSTSSVGVHRRTSVDMNGDATLCTTLDPTVSSLQWWLVSGPGTGGLMDPSTPDAHVARDAMSAASHIELGDYVLLYATKKEPRSISDPRSGRSRTVCKEVSTWTWRIRSEVRSAVRAEIDDACRRLEYGAEPGNGKGGWGLRGLLATQRRRPLFAGVRNDVIEIHRYARDAWDARRPMWLRSHPDLAARYAGSAGALRPIGDVMKDHLPTMPRVRLYDDPPLRVADLLQRFERS